MKRNHILPLIVCFLISKLMNAQENNHISFKEQITQKDKGPSFGGRIMFDNAFFTESSLLNKSFETTQNKSGNQFRRLFLYAAGNLQTNIEYKLQVNLINGQVGLRDAYIGFKNIPLVGKIRLGQVKEPIRLSVLNSSNYLTFLERSFLTDFLPIRNSGILLMNDFFEKKISYQLGVFRNSDKNTGDDKVSQNASVITGRLTSIPIYNNQEFLHIGISGTYRKYDEDTYSVSSKPESNLSNISYAFIDGLNDVGNVNIYNSEIAYGYKSWNFQGEFMSINVNRSNVVNKFKTYYGQASWFVTGEHKQIKDSYSMFKRLQPNSNKYLRGAWEIALRYSYVDMNNKDVVGGVQKDVTFGLNWYLNSSTRVMFNQVYGEVVDNGNIEISQIRFQVDF